MALSGVRSSCASLDTCAARSARRVVGLLGVGDLRHGAGVATCRQSRCGSRGRSSSSWRHRRRPTAHARRQRRRRRFDAGAAPAPACAVPMRSRRACSARGGRRLRHGGAHCTSGSRRRRRSRRSAARAAPPLSGSRSSGTQADEAGHGGVERSGGGVGAQAQARGAGGVGGEHASLGGIDDPRGIAQPASAVSGPAPVGGSDARGPSAGMDETPGLEIC